MTDAKSAYKANHSEIRGLARHFHGVERAVKLTNVCDQRRFWFGDTWCAPASAPAQAALRVLNGSMRGDPLLCNVQLAGMDLTMYHRKLVAKVVHGALRTYR